MTSCPESLTNLNIFTNSIADHDMIACSGKIDNTRYKSKVIKLKNYADYSPKKLKSDVTKI